MEKLIFVGILTYLDNPIPTTGLGCIVVLILNDQIKQSYIEFDHSRPRWDLAGLGLCMQGYGEV